MSDLHLFHADDGNLNEYLDGALVPAWRLALEQHLTGCASCAARLAELRALDAALDALPDLALERDLVAAVMTAVAPGVAPGVDVARPAARAGLGWDSPRWDSPRVRLALGVQTVIALALLGVAWPLVAASLSATTVFPLGVPVAALAAELQAYLMAQWLAWTAGVQELAASGADWTRLLSAPDVPWSSWGLPLAVAALLWLIGNGVLLTPRGGDRFSAAAAPRRARGGRAGPGG